MSSGMPRPMVLEVAGITIEVRPSDPGIQMVAGPAHIPFLTEGAGDDCTSVVLGPSPSRVARRRGGRPMFDIGSVWRLEEIGDGRLLTFRSPVFGSEPYLVAEFDRDYTRGIAETLIGGPHLAEGKLHPFVSPFDEVVFLARLSRHRGVLMHGCGLSYKGRGFLFLGTSGSGKTTIARLWMEHNGVTILSDDRVVIRVEGDEHRIYGTPWRGEPGCEAPGFAPLEAVFILEQGPRNRIDALSPAAAVAQMIVRAFPAMWDQEGLEFAVRFLTRLAERVPVRTLRFQADRSAVECVLGVLDGRAGRGQEGRR